MRIYILQISLALFFSFMLNSCTHYQPNTRVNIARKNKKIVQKCSFLPYKRRPKWIDDTNYIDKKYYYGVGVANFDSDTSNQIKRSEMNAKKSLSEQIFIKIDADSALEKLHYMSDIKDIFLKKYRSIINTGSLNYLIGMQIKDRWLNRQTCELWTLAIVKKSEVEQLKKKISKQIELFYKMRQDYAKAKDKYLPIKSRLKSVDKALHTIEKFDVVLIQQVDFLNKNINYMLWQKKINSLKAQLHREQQIALEKNKYKKIEGLYRSIYNEQLSKKQRYNNINKAKQILDNMQIIRLEETYKDLQSKYYYYRRLLQNDFIRIAKLGSSKRSIISKFGKPDKNIEGLSFDTTAIKYKDIWALFENDKLKCILKDKGLVYLNRFKKTFYSCRWYIKNQPDLVIKE